jgi:phosphatidylglycerol:prolipoprotein diacylglycerol transferase
VNLGPLHLHPFSSLLVAAVLVGFLAAGFYARRLGISREGIARLSVWMVLSGALGAILFKFAYRPELIAHGLADPRWLLRHMPGISSFGGVFGGLLGALLFFHAASFTLSTRLRYLEAVGFSLPFAWSVGRLGCALVHDHPGRASDSWLAFGFPGGGRFDLGVLECIFLAALSLVFAFLARKPRPTGFFFALYFAVYGPFRFALDQLHIDPPRYFGITVDQYCSVTAIFIAATTAWFIIRESRVVPVSKISMGETSCSSISLHA